MEVLENRKRGGPYTKTEIEKRRAEVFALHFEQGISAVKIGQVLKVNRNTINNDISYWYSRLDIELESYGIEAWFMKQVYRVESQRTRLLEKLGNTQDFKEEIILEKMISDIDSKLMSFGIRIINSRETREDDFIQAVNISAKKKKYDSITKYKSYLHLPPRSRDKVLKIIRDSRMNNTGHM